MTLAPSSVDTTASEAVVFFDLHIVDDRFDFSDAPGNAVNVAFPRNHGGGGEYFGTSALLSGTLRDGVFRARHALPRYSPAGVYTVTSVDLHDVGGRSTSLGYCELVARGFPTEFTQTGVVSDTQPPVLHSFTVTPADVNTDAADVTVTFQLHVLDPGVGVGDLAHGDVMVLDPAGNGVGAEFGVEQRISGDPHDGVYATSMLFPRYAHRGFYHLEVAIEDDAQNRARLQADALQMAGLPFSIHNTASTEDLSGPVLTGFDLSPRTQQVNPGQMIHVVMTLQITDDLSGLGSTTFAYSSMVSLRAPDGSLESAGFGQADIVSGSPTDGTFQMTQLLWNPQVGTYLVEHVKLADRVGNDTTFTAQQLQAAGFPTSFVLE